MLSNIPRSDLMRITGRQRRSAIIRHLDRMHIRYALDADGWPIVLEAVMLARLGGSAAPIPAKEPQLRLRNG